MLFLLAGCAPEPRYPEVVAAILARVDVDGDGRVSAREYAAVGDGEPLARWDGDGDGALSATELEAMFLETDPTARRPRPGGPRPPDVQMPGGPMPPGQVPGGPPR